MIELDIQLRIRNLEKDLREAIEKKEWILANRIADEIRELKKILKKIYVPMRTWKIKKVEI